MQRHRLFASSRTRDHTPQRLGGHLTREEVEDGIDVDILPLGLQERRGRQGAGLLTTELSRTIGRQGHAGAKIDAWLALD